MSKESNGLASAEERLNQLGSLEFLVMWDGGTTDPDVHPCLPVGNAVYVFSFFLVLWQVSGLSRKKPIAPTYNFFKVYLRSAIRSAGGNTADLTVPFVSHPAGQ